MHRIGRSDAKEAQSFNLPFSRLDELVGIYFNKKDNHMLGLSWGFDCGINQVTS